MHLIKEIVDVRPYELDLRFDSGEIRTVDLKSDLQEWSKSPDSIFSELLDPEYFMSVKLNQDFETVYWENGIDLCPDVLYQKSYASALT